MKIRTYKGDKIKTAAEICLKEGLYQPGWTFQDTFRYYLNDIEYIRIAEFKGKPVGCFVKYALPQWGAYNCGTFVLPEFRRQKVGTKLLPKLDKKNLLCGEGIKGSLTFYEKNKVTIG